MRVTVNAEFSDEELKKYGLELLLKGIGHAARVFGDVLDPGSMGMFFAGLQSVISQIPIHVVRNQARPQGVVGPPTHSHRGPTTGYGHDGSMPPGSPTAATAFQQLQQLLMQMSAGPAGPQASNVQPIPIREASHVEQCFPIGATRNTEVGVGCCRCATFNSVQRTQCRHCGHVLCHGAPPIVTPSPEPVAPPEPPEAS